MGQCLIQMGLWHHFSKVWYAWSLTPGWRAEGGDISWAESITLEMARLILTNEEYHDCSVIVHGKNTGIIGA